MAAADLDPCTTSPAPLVWIGSGRGRRFAFTNVINPCASTTVVDRVSGLRIAPRANLRVFQMRKDSLQFIARDILSAFFITLRIGWVSVWIKIQLGLKWLVTGAGVSMVLSCLNIAFLWYVFSVVRETCWSAGRIVNPRVAFEWSCVVTVGNVLLLCVALALTVGHIKVSSSHDVGWIHYFSLPPDRRPGFLLACLLLSAFESCIIAPVLEELLYIGVIIGRLRNRNTCWLFIHLVSAMLFILLHQAFAKEWIGWRRRQ